MSHKTYTVTLVDISARVLTFPKVYTTLPSAQDAVIAHLKRTLTYDLPPIRWHRAPPRWTLYLPDAYVIITEAEIEFF